MTEPSFEYPRDAILDLKIHPKASSPAGKNANLHLGQTKLFSNELAFILSYVFKEVPSRSPPTREGVPPRDSLRGVPPRKVILYVGAGPGFHLIYLIKMFPNIEWHLFDVRFCDDLLAEARKPNPRVFIEKSYFDENAVTTYREMSTDPNIDFYLISDIRDLSFDSRNWSLEEEHKVIEDMLLQKSWVESLRPKYSMLKFRLPYADTIDTFGEEIMYLDGTIFKQPFAKKKSTETRLIVDGDVIRDIPYSLREFEPAMSYHNMVIRGREFIFPLSDQLNGKEVSRLLKINKKYDCAYLITLLHTYFVRTGVRDLAVIESRIMKLLEKLSTID